jgi:tight adherence protein C
MSELDHRLLPILAAGGACIVLALLGVRRMAIDTPRQDRRWHDRPPTLWRLCWPAVTVLAHQLHPLLPARSQVRLQQSLRRGGLEFALDAPQFVAGRLLAAIAAAAVAAVTAHPLGAAAYGAAIGAAIGWLLPASWLRDHGLRRSRSIGRALPFYLDVVTLSVESGANLTGALAHAVDRGPAGPLRDELARVLRDIRAGRTRAEAMRAFAERVDTPAVASWVSALVAADRHGSGFGRILRAQAEQRRQERFQLAEKLAMQAPVKMLFPLLVFIFPCTFVLLFFPIVVRLLEEGLLR